MSSARASRARIVWWAGLLLGLGLSVCARAAPRERAPVLLELAGCPKIDEQAVARLLAIELGQAPVARSAAPPGATRARVMCAPPRPAAPPADSLALDGQTAPAGASEGAPGPSADPGSGERREGGAPIELRVDDAVTGKSLWRSIDLGAADPAVQARLLALALAELLFASWAELLVTPTPQVPPAAPAASPAERRATSDSLQRKLAPPPLGLQLSAVAAALVLFGSPRLSLGGGLQLRGDHGHHLGWDLDVLYHRGSTSTALGEVSADLLSARLGLGGHLRVPHVILRGGVGARFGAARLAGQATDPATATSQALWGAFGGPLGALGLTAAAGRLRIDLCAEAGYVVSPVAARVNGSRAVAIEGPWLGIQLGLGAFLR